MRKSQTASSKREAVARAAVGFCALRDDLRERDFYFFLELLVLLFRRREQVDQLALELREAGSFVVERKFVGDCSLGLGDVLHQSAERGVLFVERELLDHHVDLGLQMLCRRRRGSW